MVNRKVTKLAKKTSSDNSYTNSDSKSIAVWKLISDVQYKAITNDYSKQ